MSSIEALYGDDPDRPSAMGSLPVGIHLVRVNIGGAQRRPEATLEPAAETSGAGVGSRDVPPSRAAERSQEKGTTVNFQQLELLFSSFWEPRRMPGVGGKDGEGSPGQKGPPRLQEKRNPILFSNSLRRFSAGASAEAHRALARKRIREHRSETPRQRQPEKRRLSVPQRCSLRPPPYPLRFCEKPPSKPPPRGEDGGLGRCKSRHKGFWRHPSYKSSLAE